MTDSMVNVWEDELSEQDQSVIRKAGYDESGATSWDSRGTGDSPLILVIDMQIKATGPDGPILDAIDQYRTGMGEIAWRGIEQIQSLLETGRDSNVPVIYTRSVPTSYDDPYHDDLQIVDDLAPEPEDAVIDKSYASAFYGTDLVSRLVRRDVDTLVVVGATTSGCVRSTVIDAQSNGFDVIVPSECVFDRIQLSHKATLLDLWMKYAEVLPRADVEEYLEVNASDT